MPAKFSLGRVVATSNALAELSAAEIQQALSRHVAGDWGEVCPDDARANERALVEGLRLLSVYTVANGTRFWILTEADRSATTVMLPEDY